MILDSLQHADPYRRLGDRFAAAFDFLRAADPAHLPLGRQAIDGDNLYATVMEGDLKPADQGAWEAHRQYIDIQYLISGAERMGVAEIGQLTASHPYDASADVQWFIGSGQRILVPAGFFAVFFPQDVHMPGLRKTDTIAGRSRKIVVKLRR